MNISQKKLKQIVKKLPLILVALLVVGLLGYFLAYKPYAVKKDRELFTKAEATTEEMYSKVIATIGQPDQLQREKSCDRANLKSEKGPLLCDVSINLQYSDKDLSNSNDVLHSLQSLGTSPIRIGSGAANGNEFVSPTNQKGLQMFFQDYTHIGKLNCTLGYIYPYEGTNTPAAQGIEVALSCSGPAKAEHFPLKD
jgi:hypothetical protein